MQPTTVLSNCRGMTDGPRSRPAGSSPVRLHGDVPHHLSKLHHRAVRLYCDPPGPLDRHGPRASPPPGPVLDQDLRGFVRHGRRLGDRAELPVRDQWSRFSVVVGNVIAPLIGYEVLTAFFLEATFLGVMLFGGKRVPPGLHVFAAIAVAVGTAMSAFWILSANSWMQTPTGHEVRDGIAYPVDWFAVIFNPSFFYRLPHM